MHNNQANTKDEYSLKSRYLQTGAARVFTRKEIRVLTQIRHVQFAGSNKVESPVRIKRHLNTYLIACFLHVLGQAKGNMPQRQNKFIRRELVFHAVVLVEDKLTRNRTSPNNIKPTKTQHVFSSKIFK